MTKRKTHEEFVREIKDKYSNEYEILGYYVNAKTKILIRHNICNNSFKMSPDNFSRGKQCPHCKRGKISKHFLKTTKEFKEEILKKYNNKYTILGEYVNARTKIKVRHNCKKCNYHEWEITPNNLLYGYGCPVCSGKVAKLGINTIWDTDRWMVDLGVSESDAKKYTHRSKNKIFIKCSNCGKKKRIQIANIYNNKSIGCSCGDGKSYPEKFVLNLLEQLDVDFKTEYSPEWVKPKRYDFYIKDNNCIIEANGLQHYKESFITLGGKVLKEEQANDKFKKETALTNGINHYVELDCRESNLEWIKNSILNSELANLFDLSKIDWLQCAEFANKNIVKEICDYWNNKQEDETTSDLAKIFNLEKSTVNKYLKKGIELGWCNYDPKEEMRKSVSKNGKNNGKKVEIFKNGKSLGVFESCSGLERQSKKLFNTKLLAFFISQVCREIKSQYKGFTFKYVEENK